MKKLHSYFTFLLLICPVFVHAQKRLVNKGNKLYEQKKYKEASATYQQALKNNPNYTPGLFNLGNSLYQQKNYDASRKIMNNTAKLSKDKNVKADAHYNVGNTYMQEQKWDEAIEAYKQALRNNPQDEAAKYNLSYALAMKKKQNGGGGKNNDKNKNQDKQDQNKDQQNKNDQDQKDQQNKDQQNKDQQNKNDKDQQDQNKNDRQDQPKPQPSKLTEQQADQLLNALSQEEKKLHDKKEKGKVVPVKVEKDW